MKKKQYSIGKRIFLQFFSLLSVVCASILVAFNLYFIHYINADAKNQLDTIVRAMEKTTTEKSSQKNETDSLKPKDEKATAPQPTLSHILKGKVRSEAKIFNMNRQYTVTDYDKADSKKEIQKIAAALHKNKVSMKKAQYVHIKTAYGEYYISAITDPVLKNTYMVFAVNVTAARNFEKTINEALILIIVAAMLICLAVVRVITRTVTTPLKQIGSFAEAIGQGDFRKREFNLKDREFMELAEAMNVSAKRLDAYDKDQHQFFQNVSHELRTPLMSIRCYAEGIACGVMEPKKAGGVIISETEKLSKMVENLLYISKMDRHPVLDKTEEGDLRETVATCASEFSALAEKANIRLEFVFDENPVCYNYNENHIFYAVGNLLSNALRYAKTEIVLTCKNTQTGVEIIVEDDGPGIAQKDRDHIFDRFYKGEGGKTGIGLSIVKSVVELYNGTVTLTEGAGGKFKMELPKKNA